ncbi:MAG TPA: glycine oxidase ThiO, partial [Vicinamibacteria bacterium]|nr:glycine oxidase ThiO [Vicinamibacteria bacterium]
VGAEASSAAAGILSPQAESESDSPLLDLALMARDYYLALVPALEGETGIHLDHSTRGLIEVAFSEDEERRLDRRLSWQRSRGLHGERLTRDEVLESEPNLNPALRGGVFLPGDHRVDNVRLTRALAASAVGRGATLLSGRPATGLLTEGGNVAGIRAGSETYHAPVVINAMGAWAGALPGDPFPPPVEPVRGQMIAFELAPPFLRHVVYSPRGYLVPRSDGRLLAGSTVERAGFEKSVTAWGLRTILDLALEIAPLLADVAVAESWAGLRPGTPDGLPVLGHGALPGLIHATGLYRNGILLGPLVGEIAAALAVGEAPPVDLKPFALMRFAPTRPDS